MAQDIKANTTTTTTQNSTTNCRRRRPSMGIVDILDPAPPPGVDDDIEGTPLSELGSSSSSSSQQQHRHHQRLPLHLSHSHHLQHQYQPRRHQQHQSRRYYPHSHHQSTSSSSSQEPLGSHPCEASPPTSLSRLPPVPITYRRGPIALERTSSDMSSAAEEGEAGPSITEGTPLIADSPGRWWDGPLFMTAVKLAVLFAGFSALVLGTFWFGMPNVADEDRPALKIPSSFAELQALNDLLHKYKDLYPWRLCLCGVVAYLYVQAFTLPGSMYISILFGAAYGILPGLLLSCLCDSTGSILCYTLSAILAPPLLELPFYRKKLETWRKKIMGDADKGNAVGWDSVFAILLILRIMPLPPHWMANFAAPHLGIGRGMFWLTCFIGIAPVSVIHVTIGSSLDQMTSAEDFHILSVRNVLGLSAVVVAVLIPVGLKRVFRKDLGDFADEEEEESTITHGLDTLQDIPAPVPVQFDEHGLPQRYQAVDSGVLLAGPSEGDPAFDLEPEARPRSQPPTVGKGKGRGLEIITTIGGDSDGSAYELDGATTTSPANRGRGGSGKRSMFRPLMGYGTIQLPPDEQPTQSSSRWWQFAGR